jgi:hypothetical protein
MLFNKNLTHHSIDYFFKIILFIFIRISIILNGQLLYFKQKVRDFIL